MPPYLVFQLMRWTTSPSAVRRYESKNPRNCVDFKGFCELYEML
ncbi:hypothetical protein PEC301645_03040 [Pectobacterium carotovorum subsp. carotovorum]|nr:hypothetical protein PEC301645_03040 [Pectobacterium carotovorum subsp. carotovorum]